MPLFVYSAPVTDRFSGTVKQTGTPCAQVIRNGTTPRQRPGRWVILVPESRLQGHAASAQASSSVSASHHNARVELNIGVDVVNGTVWDTFSFALHRKSFSIFSPDGLISTPQVLSVTSRRRGVRMAVVTADVRHHNGKSVPPEPAPACRWRQEPATAWHHASSIRSNTPTTLQAPNNLLSTTSGCGTLNFP